MGTRLCISIKEAVKFNKDIRDEEVKPKVSNLKEYLKKLK